MIPESRPTFRWFGRRPYLCLIPLGLYVLLLAAKLFARHYGGVFLPEPFGILVAVGLLALFLATLAISLAWWVRNNVAEMLKYTLGEVLPQLASILAKVTQDSVYNRKPAVTWNADTQSGHVYASTGRPAVGGAADVFGQMIRQEYPADPPTGEIRAS